MRACVTDGNCGEKLKNLEQPMAAKTGTAEVGDWTTANLVGYGPVDDPKVSFACSAPLSSVNSRTLHPTSAALMWFLRFWRSISSCIPSSDTKGDWMNICQTTKQGTAHQLFSVPNQDALAFEMQDGRIIAAVCDGVSLDSGGNWSRSQIAAAFCADAFVSALRSAL